jgi:two-component system response regulator DegU
MIRVLLVDDHTLVREGLKRGLSAEDDLEVVGEASNGEEAVTAVASMGPDVVLMDVSMPVCDGVEATKRLRRSNPDLPVVMLTMHSDSPTLTSAIRAGASGYLLKDARIEEVADAIRTAARGDTALTPELATSMLEEFRRLARGDQRMPGPILTKREEEVLQHIADGLSTQEVAEKLYISIKTVKNHLASIYDKLDASDRTQAVVQAVKLGIIRLD